MNNSSTTIFSDLLSAAKVRHTTWYSDKEFKSMPFSSLFGLTKLLKSYGVESSGLELANKGDIDHLPTPFVAETSRGLVIVTEVTQSETHYLSQGESITAPTAEIERAMTGRVLVIWPDADASEPDYDSHAFTAIANRYKRWVLLGCVVALGLWLFITNGLYRHLSTILLTLINAAGVYIGFLLVQKSAHIKNPHADAVCAVVEEGGCDDVLNMDAAKFFGVFGWSEVGLSYFAVSLGCLLIFPQYIGYLAGINLICLPFSFWSVWYQKFRAKTWCTLCLTVQSMLWLLFICYLTGGWLKEALPLSVEFFVLGISYVAVMLGINALMPWLDRRNCQITKS